MSFFGFTVWVSPLLVGAVDGPLRGFFAVTSRIPAPLDSPLVAARRHGGGKVCACAVCVFAEGAPNCQVARTARRIEHRAAAILRRWSPPLLRPSSSIFSRLPVGSAARTALDDPSRGDKTRPAFSRYLFKRHFKPQ